MKGIGYERPKMVVLLFSFLTSGTHEVDHNITFFSFSL